MRSATMKRFAAMQDSPLLVVRASTAVFVATSRSALGTTGPRQNRLGAAVSSGRDEIRSISPLLFSHYGYMPEERRGSPRTTAAYRPILYCVHRKDALLHTLCPASVKASTR